MAHPPKRLKMIFMRNWVQFPHAETELTLTNPQFSDSIKKDKFAIVAYAAEHDDLPDLIVSAKLGALGFLEAFSREEGETDSHLRFRFLMRVMVKEPHSFIIGQDAGGRDIRAFTCKWEEVRTPEIPDEVWNKEEIQHQFLYMRQLFLLFSNMAADYIISDLAENQFLVPEEKKEKIAETVTKSQSIIQKFARTDKSTIDHILDETADAALALCNLLPNVKGAAARELLDRFNDTLYTIPIPERLFKLIENLIWLVDSFEKFTNAAVQEEAGDWRKPLRELLKILFYDEGAHAGTESGDGINHNAGDGDVLDLPEGLEPPFGERMKKYLSERVIGQERPIRVIARAFNLAKAGLLPRAKRPLLNLFLSGPSATGKTELAFALSDLLGELEKEALKRAREKNLPLPFTEEDIQDPPLIMVDCGMFAGSLSHGVSNLIGSPVGFVGSKCHAGNYQPPILSAERFPKNRLRVLLFDEIEKAFIDSRDRGAELKGVLMKILDKGEFVNNANELVDFSRTVIIFTSNVGAVQIIKSAQESHYGFKAEGIRADKKRRLSEEDIEKLNDKIYWSTKKEYEEVIPPDFRNRIHRFIVFRFPTDANYRAIIEKEFRNLKDDVKEFGISLELGADAVEWILDEIKAEEGVRKLRDLMQKEIAEPLARAYNLGKLKAGKIYEAHTKKVKARDGNNGQTEIKVIFKIKDAERDSQ